MISFDEFLKQDEADKYNMLQECNAIIQQKENIIKEVREYIEKEYLSKFDDFERPLRMTNKNDWNKVLEILGREDNDTRNI